MQEVPKEIIHHIVNMLQDPLDIVSMAATCRQYNRYFIETSLRIKYYYLTLRLTASSINAVCADTGSLRLLKIICQRFIAYHGSSFSWDPVLSTASFHGYLDIVQYSIEHGGATVLDLASYHAGRGEQRHIIEYLRSIQAVSMEWGMRGAVKAGNLSLVEYCIEHGARGWQGGFETAAYEGNITMMNYFYDRGARPDEQMMHLLAHYTPEVKQHLTTLILKDRSDDNDDDKNT